MLHFVGGFVIGLLIGAVVFLYKERFKTQTDPNQQLTQIEELSRLTGGLAHEIKNPLSTIKLNLDLVGEELEELTSTPSVQTGSGGNNSELRRALRQIAIVQKEADRLEQILEDFLHYIG